MLRICVAFALLAALPAAAGAATVAFDSFGTNDAFDSGEGGLVGPGPTGDVELGLVFTSLGSGQIASLSVAFSSTAPPSVATFTVFEWTGVSRGAEVDFAPVKIANGAAQVVEVGNWQGSLAAGSRYVLFATSTSVSDWWASANQIAGEMVYQIGGVQGVEPGWAAAARIEHESVGAPAPVPLPGALPLLVVGVGALALVRRRIAG